MKVQLGLLVLLAVLALAMGACKGVTATEPIKEIDLTLTSYLAAGMPEQDVFVEVPGDSGNVRRVTTHDYERYLAAPVYAAQYHVDHDPFQVSSEPLGPYAKGDDLGFTLEQWLAATSTGTYTMAKYRAEIALSFQNLVPNGVYSFWYREIAFPPDAQIPNRPWRGTGGSHDIFRADDQGNAEFRLVVRPLSESTDDTMAVLAVVYHSDGRTGGGPYWGGDYGLTSHVQVLALIPAAGDQGLADGDRQIDGSTAISCSVIPRNQVFCGKTWFLAASRTSQANSLGTPLSTGLDGSLLHSNQPPSQTVTWPGPSNRRTRRSRWPASRSRS